MSASNTVTSAHATRPARLPAIVIPSGTDAQTRVFFEALKERSEVREGSRGNPFERAATMRDLEALKTSLALTAAAPAPASASADSADSVSEGQVRQWVGSAIGTESAALRAQITSTERNLNATLASMRAAAVESGGISSLQSQAYGRNRPYTNAALAADLASGAATILAGAASGTTVMELDPAGSYVLFKHRSANIRGLGAAYTGTVRTAVGITAAGFLAGYNRLSDGAWQSSIVIDSATGNVTILGTLKAGSVVEADALVGLGGPTLGTVATNASTATKTAADALLTANTANAATADMAADNKLTAMEKQALRGTWDQIAAEKAGLNTQAGTFTLTTQNTAYNNAFQSLATYLNAGVTWTSGVPSIISTASLTTTTDIVGSTLRSTVQGYYDARTALLNAVALKAKTLADQASSDAAAALSSASSKLSAGSSYVLSGAVTVQDTGGLRAGNVTWDAATGAVTGGSGVVLTENGLTGVKAGVTTFSITAAGDAAFYGTIDGGGMARFSGLNSGGGAQVTVGTTTYNVEYSSWSNGASSSASGNVRAGSVGYASAPISFRNVGVLGIAEGAGKGIGVVGDGSATGGYFISKGAGGAVEGYNNVGSGPGGYFYSQFGVAAHVDGALKWGSYTLAKPDGTSSSQFLSRDGTWRTGVVGPTGPQGPQGPQGQPGPTSGNADSLGNFFANNWTRYISTNNGVALASGQGIYMSGSANTQIAGAYVRTYGSGSTVELLVTSSSPSDSRLKDNIADCALGLDFVRQLRPVSYSLIADGSKQIGYGFIAQEVEQLIAAGTSLVYDDPDQQTGKIKGHKVIHYPSYIAVLTRAIQQLLIRIERLENP